MILLLLLFSYVFSFDKESFSSLQSKTLSYQPQLNFIQRQLKNMIAPALSNNGDISVICALCGIAVNEVEGFLIEEKTQTEIIDELKANFCPFLGPMEPFCDILVGYVPSVINMIENQQNVSDVCIELKFCDKPFPRYDDPVSVPRYTINLDLPPFQRFQGVCAIPQFQAMANFLITFVTSVLPDGGKYLQDIGEMINDLYFPPDRRDEVIGCAEAMNIPYGWLALLNVGYEVSDACTSILAQTPDGRILHARNLDFWAGYGFTNTLKNMTFIADFKKGGKTVFSTVQFAGYVGVLSGFKNRAFSVTINTRFYPGGIGELFYEIIAAIKEKNASLVSFLLREVMETNPDFPSAVTSLSNRELIADVYYTVAGVSSGQGAVISRNRMNATDVWRLDVKKGRWFEVQTNYDHWNNPPWFDDRVDPGNKGMSAMGFKNATLDGMFKVLSTKPIMNIQTTYSLLACPADGTFKGWARYCNYPCVE